MDRCARIIAPGILLLLSMSMAAVAMHANLEDTHMSVQSVDANKQLHRAARRGNAAEVEHLLADGNVDINAEDCDYKTPLHHAAQEGFTQIVELLLRVPRVIIDAKDIGCWTPLILAIQDGHLEAVKCLIAGGANINGVEPRHSDYWPITQASKLAVANFEVLKVLRPNAKSRDIFEHMYSNLIEIVKYLLSNGASLNNNKMIIRDLLRLIEWDERNSDLLDFLVGVQAEACLPMPCQDDADSAVQERQRVDASTRVVINNFITDWDERPYAPLTRVRLDFSGYMESNHDGLYNEQ